MLQELENIDDDADTAGIPIVKLEDKALAKTVGVYSMPAVVFFKNFGGGAVFIIIMTAIMITSSSMTLTPA